MAGSRYNFFHMAFSIGTSIGTFVTYVIPTNIKAALVSARDAFPRAPFTPAAPKTDARSSFVNFPRQEVRQPDKAPSVWPSRSATLHGKGENKTERGKSVSMDRYVLTFRRSTLSTRGIDDAFPVKHVCDTGITNSSSKRIVRHRFVRKIYFVRVETLRSVGSNDLPGSRNLAFAPG